MKTKKMLKEALKHPELHSDADLAFFEKWLRMKKEEKQKKKEAKHSDR